MNNTGEKFHSRFAGYIASLSSGFDKIPTERQETLKTIGNYIINKKTNKEKAVFTVICTHNSRRSHFGQLWIKIAAEYYGIKNIESFSGGTIATAFNEKAVAALERAGFYIKKNIRNDPNNPIYSVSIEADTEVILMYSKKYDDNQNPQEGFAAIMVCSEADQNCPLIPGADARFALPYEDPKNYDNTSLETAKYDERCKQIGTEIFFIFDYVKNNQPKPVNND